VDDWNRFRETKRRGHILQILATSAEAGCNVPMIRSLLRDVGHRAPEETVAIDLAFLRDNGFLVLRDVGSIEFAKLTPRGRDVARGDLVVPGIERPES
jgi:hypothetical protein